MFLRKDLVALLGIGNLLALSIVFYITFLFAYFKDYTVKIHINLWNEALFEFVLFPICIIWGMYSINYYHGEYVKKIKNLRGVN